MLPNYQNQLTFWALNLTLHCAVIPAVSNTYWLLGKVLRPSHKHLPLTQTSMPAWVSLIFFQPASTVYLRATSIFSTIGILAGYIGINVWVEHQDKIYADSKEARSNKLLPTKRNSPRYLKYLPFAFVSMNGRKIYVFTTNLYNGFAW